MPKLELLFDEADRAKAYVCIRHGAHGKKIILTRACGGPSEFDTAVNELKSDLESVVKAARAEFRRFWRAESK